MHWQLCEVFFPASLLLEIADFGSFTVQNATCFFDPATGRANGGLVVKHLQRDKLVLSACFW